MSETCAVIPLPLLPKSTSMPPHAVFLILFPENYARVNIRKLCQRIVPWPYNSVRELFLIIASQNAPSSNKPPVTLALNSSSLSGQTVHLDATIQEATYYLLNSPSLSEQTVHLDPTIQQATCYPTNSPSLSSNKQVILFGLFAPFLASTRTSLVLSQHFVLSHPPLSSC